MAAPVAPGDVLGGKFRVDRVLGEGGMGVVVAATHLQLDQRVAIKFMLPAAFENPEALARFAREARAAVKLRSEHVARVLDTGTFETGAPYIVMEYLEGTDLAGELQRTGAMPPQVAAEYIVQACEAIAEAHSLGIVHRDLKPANLFLARRPDGSPLVKVLDFGISKATSLNERGLAMTKTAAVMGSPLYMSPEQMKSTKDVDPRTDVWSLGVILYELLGGRTPFHAETLGELLAAVLTEPTPPLAGARPGLPPALCALVDRCLQKDRALRCQSVAEIARGLAPFCPPRVMPIVDRVSLILGEGAAPLHSGQPISPHAHTAAAPNARAGAPAQTGGAWGGTHGVVAPPRRGSAGVWAVAVAGILLLGAGAAGAIALKSRSKAPAETTSPGAPAAPSATAIVPTVPPAPSVASASASASAAASAPSTQRSPVLPASTTAATAAMATTTRKGVPPRAPPATAGTKPVASGASPSPAPAPPAPAPSPGILDTSN
jgi:eukaryotic-like serine/threonine-protein kinase